MVTYSRNKNNLYLLYLRNQIAKVRKEILYDYQLECHSMYIAMANGLKALLDFIDKARYTIYMRLSKKQVMTLLVNYFRVIERDYNVQIGAYSPYSVAYLVKYYEIQYYQLRHYLKRNGAL